MFDAAIKSERILLPSGISPGYILIKDGCILDLVDELSRDHVSIADVGNNVVMPAVFDPHVHINEPGRTDWEGFDTATRAALAGGICNVIDMPLNSAPVTTSKQSFDAKLKAAENNLNCNCGFWGGIIPGNTNNIEEMILSGVLGFKAFLTHSGIDDFPNVTHADLKKAMPIIAQSGLPLLVHCELESAQRQVVGDERSYINYKNSRPPAWEHEAIKLMISLCREFRCRTHIVHVSSAGSLQLIRQAKEEGLPISAETAQHYLYFSEEMIDDGRTEFKCAPPIRDSLNRQQLWEGLEEGILDFVATDHSPAPPSLKHLDDGNFPKAWGGIASLQFALPALWTVAKRQNAPLHRIAQWLSSEPAKFSGLAKRNGFIAKGFDADLVVWSPEEKFVVNDDQIHHRHKVTPYLGENLYGVVKETWLHGTRVYADGKFIHLNKGRIILNK